MSDLTQSEPKVCSRCGGEGVYLILRGPMEGQHHYPEDCIRSLRERLDALEARVAGRQDVAVGPTEGA